MRTRTLPIVLLSFLISATALHAQGVRFVSGSWDDVLKKARAEKKMILVDAYTEWCGWCKEMDKRTFPDAKVGVFIAEHFIAWKIDMEKGFGIALARKYRVFGFPTYLYCSSDGRLLYRSVGFQEPAEYLKTLADAVDPAKHMKHPGDPAAFDLPWPEFYVAAFATGKERQFPKPETVSAWLDTQTDPLSEVVWDVIMRFQLPEKHEHLVIDNKDALMQRYGTSEVNDKLSAIVYARAEAAIKAKDRAAFARAKEFAAKAMPENAADMLPSLDLHFSEETGDWTSYAAVAQQLIDRTPPVRDAFINDMAWRLYEKCDNTAVLTRALGWMQKVTAREPSYMYIDTQAALLYKLAQYDEAETVARWAIKVGKEAKEKVGDTEKLLVKIRDAKKSAAARKASDAK